MDSAFASLRISAPLRSFVASRLTPGRGYGFSSFAPAISPYFNPLNDFSVNL